MSSLMSDWESKVWTHIYALESKGLISLYPNVWIDWGYGRDIVVRGLEVHPQNGSFANLTAYKKPSLRHVDGRLVVGEYQEERFGLNFLWREGDLAIPLSSDDYDWEQLEQVLIKQETLLNPE